MANDRPRAKTWVLVTVAIMGFFAFVLALSAELDRTKDFSYQMDANQELYCKYPKSSSSELAVTAIFVLVLTLALANWYAGCVCGPTMRQRPGAARTIGLVALALAWLSTFIAVVVLTAASVENRYHTKSTTAGFTPLHCSLLNGGVFAAGAAFVLLAILFIEVYYMVMAKASYELWRQGNDAPAPSVDMEAFPKGAPPAMSDLELTRPAGTVPE
eukprot:jgi/Mesen1/10847/ME000093S10366